MIPQLGNEAQASLDKTSFAQFANGQFLRVVYEGSGQLTYILEGRKSHCITRSSARKLLENKLKRKGFTKAQ